MPEILSYVAISTSVDVFKTNLYADDVSQISPPGTRPAESKMIGLACAVTPLADVYAVCGVVVPAA